MEEENNRIGCKSNGVYTIMKLKKAQKDDPRRCANCTHFYQHYFMPKYQEGKLMACDCGHCYRERRKTTRPDRCCEAFEMREIRQCPEANQEFRLRILPDITNFK